jgi:hypothetical protein
MQLLIVIGVIAAIIYYILKMRANAKSSDEESGKSNGEGFFNNIFMPQNDVTGTHSGENADHDEELDDEDDEEDRALLGDPYDDLEKLAALYEKGILTEDEYSKKKKDLLDRI